MKKNAAVKKRAEASDSNRKKIAAAIERLLVDRGITARELALAIGVEPSMVSHWRSGRYCPSLVNAQKLANELGVSIDDILG